MIDKSRALSTKCGRFLVSPTKSLEDWARSQGVSNFPDKITVSSGRITTDFRRLFLSQKLSAECGRSKREREAPRTQARRQLKMSLVKEIDEKGSTMAWRCGGLLALAERKARWQF